MFFWPAVLSSLISGIVPSPSLQHPLVPQVVQRLFWLRDVALLYASELRVLIDDVACVALALMYHQQTWYGSDTS